MSESYAHESYAHINLFTFEMNRRFSYADIYVKLEESPNGDKYIARTIRAIPNYTGYAIETDTTVRGHQFEGINCYFVAEASLDGTCKPSDTIRYIMPREEFSEYTPIAEFLGEDWREVLLAG